MCNRCWLGFGGNKMLMTYLLPILLFISHLLGYMQLEFKRKYIIYSLIVYVVSIMNLKSASNLNGYIYQAFVPINIFFVLSIPDDGKRHVFEKIVKWFGFIMLMGIFLYLINLVVNLPSLGTMIADYGNAEITAGRYANYLFYIKPIEYLGEGIRRFSGPFIEPGDLGCVAAFILMAARFDFKRYKNLKWVLVGLLLSLSLAGWILAFIGYLLILFSDKRISGSSVFFFVLLIVGSYLFAIFYNGGDNLINEKILSRLQVDEDTGFSGNNRTSLLKMEYFAAMFSNPNTMLFGYDQSTIAFLNENNLGAGFINEVISIGFIGMIGLILPYLMITLKSRYRVYPVCFFVLFILYMFQRTEATSICFVLCYVYGIVIYEFDKQSQIV